MNSITIIDLENILQELREERKLQEKKAQAIHGN